MIEIHGRYTTARVMIDDIDPTCVSQITLFVNHPAFTNPVAIMPDTHAGKGSVIGFTMRLTDKVIPNVVGVDIGCGMLSLRLGEEPRLPLEMLDHRLRQRIPFGHDMHNRPALDLRREFPWRKATVMAEKFAAAFRREFGHSLAPPRYGEEWFLRKCKDIGGDTKRMINSLGTLGGGNHFIETGFSDRTGYWVTIHSGSRNFGKRICEYWQAKAVKKIRKERKADLRRVVEEIRRCYKRQEIQRRVKQAKQQFAPPPSSAAGLEWLEGSEAAGYLFDMIFAQIYARVNRAWMGRLICDILKTHPRERIETTHNFIDFGDFIIRKGAIRSYAGEKMIIPFNMRDGILICEGRSSREWNFSAPHGAGRVMSRSQAKKQLDMSRFRRQMRGIVSSSVGAGTLDESPDAYKDSQIIERAVAPTAVILDRIRPVHNMKDEGRRSRK